jgi:hypothetical protein
MKNSPKRRMMAISIVRWAVLAYKERTFDAAPVPTTSQAIIVSLTLCLSPSTDYAVAKWHSGSAQIGVGDCVRPPPKLFAVGPAVVQGSFKSAKALYYERTTRDYGC